MPPNFSFLLAASNAILKPRALLRWKVQLVKDAGYGRRLALLSFIQIKPWNCVLSSSLCRWLSFLVFFLPWFPRMFFQRVGFGLCRLPETRFSVFQPKALRDGARGCFSELRRALRGLTRPFALYSLSLNFLRLPPTSSHPLPLAQAKLPIPC